MAEKGVAACTQARLSIVPGASHWLHIEQPERVNREILDFLA